MELHEQALGWTVREERWKEGGRSEWENEFVYTMEKGRKFVHVLIPYMYTCTVRYTLYSVHVHVHVRIVLAKGR